jgi:hypothetical protein
MKLLQQRINTRDAMSEMVFMIVKCVFFETVCDERRHLWIGVYVKLEFFYFTRNQFEDPQLPSVKYFTMTD